jgi:diacylglycerol O-acyltransferase / wax synthase
MPPELNRRLTTSDASFLYVEKPSQPMHVGGCLVYEGHVSSDDLLAVMEERLAALPRYRQKAVFPPFVLAHPTWEDDPAFDLRRHVEEITLPAPGDDATLSEVGGAAYQGMLDRAHPLWKFVVIQGRADGNTAVLWKVHHAMVDGVSGVEIGLVLHDFKRDGDPRPAVAPSTPRPMPDPVTLLQDAVRDSLTLAAQQWTDAAFRWLRPAESSERDRKLAAAVMTTGPRLLRPAPRTPFNGPLSARRQFTWVQFPFAEIRQIRSVLGGTINDLVLAVIAGGLGRYLRARRYPTDGVELRSMCPVSMRPPSEQGALGNLVSMMLAPLYVGITDPVERLMAQRRAMEQLKAEDQAGGLYAMTGLANLIPPAWQALAAMGEVTMNPLNTVTTNVPGPQVPLYLAGRKLLHWYPLGPLGANIGLFNAILSYNQTLTIGATVDPTLVPDAWDYMGFLRESFEELREAAGRAALAAEPVARVAAQ